ncbi:MAG TPA: hypothetical protein VGM76_10785 [Lacipirellulaceae bacterium]|jgi:hypothetical protein
MLIRQATALVVLLAVAACRMAAADEDSNLRQEVLAGTQDAAIKYYTDREFKTDGEQLKGITKAIDPEKHIAVDVTSFKSSSGHVEATFRINGRFGFAGTLTVKGKSTDVKATADIRQDVEMVVDYATVENRLSIDARVTEVKFHVNLVKTEPSDIPGGEALMAEIAEKELERQKAELIKELNDWLAEQYL